MIYNQKIKESLSFTNPQETLIVFTGKADFVLSDAASALTIRKTNSPGVFRALVLDNNLTLISKAAPSDPEAVISGVRFLISETDSCGIISSSASKTTKISLTVPTASNTRAYGWSSTGSLTLYGPALRQNFNISNTAKTAESDAASVAIHVTKNLASQGDLKGTFTVTANAARYAYAYGLYTAEGDITLKALSGNMTVTAKLSSANGVSASAGAIWAKGDFTADRISGKITVTGDTGAKGFYTGDDFSVGDMSKMNLSVTSKTGIAYGIACDDYFIIGKTVLDLGKISVTSPVKAIGVYAAGNAIGTSGYTANNRLTGNITATSKTGSAWGVEILDLTETIFSATVKVTGKDFAYGIETAADLTLDGAKITAKVLDGSAETYSVHMTSYTMDNIIILTGNSILAGSIDAGKGDDTVTIESGSKLTGGLRNVENLELVINDGSKKNNALWYADTKFDSPVNAIIDPDYGLLGNFKLITKTGKNDWLDFVGQELLNYHSSDELFSYSVYTKGNDLYFKSELRSDAEGNVFESKVTTAQTLNRSAAIFTSKADVSIKDERIAIDCGSCGKVVFDNNITLTCQTVNNYALCAAVSSSGNVLVAASNVKKTLKLSNSVDFDVYNISNSKTADTCGYFVGATLTLSHKFLQNITVSVTGKKADTRAFGIKAETLAGGADISGKFTITGKADEELSLYGIHVINGNAGNISGSFNITASGMEMSHSFGIYAAQILELEKLSGTFNIKSTGIGVYGEGSTCCAVYADHTLAVNNGFTGKITVNVKNLQSSEVYGIKAGSTVALYGKNTGSISLTNTGAASKSETVGIFAKNTLKLTDYSGAITVKAVGSGTGSTSATAVASEEYLHISGVFSSKLNVSAENASGIAYASGLQLVSGTSLSVSDISGVWNISAKGFKAGAYGVYSVNGGSVTLGNVSATMNITEKSLNTDATQGAYAFSCAGEFTAGVISAKITISATGPSYGFYSGSTFSVADMSQMKLNVTSQNSKAYGICANYQSPDMIISAAGLNVGKITAKGKDDSYGICFSGNIYTEENAVCSNLSGTIRVTSTDGAAYGIRSNSFCDEEGNNAVVISADIAVSGRSANAIYISSGDVVLDNAKIKAETTGKNSFEAYAIYTSDGYDNNIYLQNNTTVTGVINTSNNSWATGDTEEDLVRIESGSKLTGALCNVEYVQLILNDSSRANQSLWDVTESDEMTRSRLWLEIEEGMTGDFLLAVNKTDSDWDDILDFSGNCQNVSLNIGNSTLTMTYGSCNYGDCNYALEEKGNKLFLTVTER